MVAQLVRAVIVLRPALTAADRSPEIRVVGSVAQGDVPASLYAGVGVVVAVGGEEAGEELSDEGASPRETGAHDGDIAFDGRPAGSADVGVWWGWRLVWGQFYLWGTGEGRTSRVFGIGDDK